MAALPVTISTAMVSPIARPVPRIIAAVIPESAPGTITLLKVCQRVAPTASDPSRNSFGTEEMASSETEMIVGSAMIPSNIDPASHDSPVGTSNEILIQFVRIIRPKNPYTTEGIPASSSIAGLMTAFTRGGASSDMKSALPIPNGTARTIAPTVTRRVPTISVKIPYEGGVPVGFHERPVRKSQTPA